MSSEHLNEHDSQQGAESKGEFLGMAGNSAWYLFGSAGASLLLVIVLWGVLGISLLLCLFLGLVLCGLSVVYVFVLINNRPQHYDTDFFEMALVEAGVIPMAFGPRARRPPNPFRTDLRIHERYEANEHEAQEPKATQRSATARFYDTTAHSTLNSAARVERGSRTSSKSSGADVATVTLAAFERLQAELNDTAAMLEDALADGEENCI